mgnify:CR=1 FL=1
MERGALGAERRPTGGAGWGGIAAERSGGKDGGQGEQSSSAVGMQKSLRWYVLARMLSDAFSSASVSSKALKNPMPRIGSTEWTEEDMDMLASRGVAYLNVDMLMFGPGSLMPRATRQL